MNDTPNQDRLVSTGALIDGLVRLVVLSLLIAWCFLIIAPFVLPVAWGIILAVAIYPLYAKLAAAFGGREKLAATVYALVALSILMGPTIMISGSVVESLQTITSDYEQGQLAISPPDASVKDWPVIGERIYNAWLLASENLTNFGKQYEEQLRDLTRSVVASVASLGGTVGVFFISILISAVLMAKAIPCYEFCVRLYSRLTNQEVGAVYANLSRDTIRSIAQGVLGIAAIQAILSAIGMYVMDVPGWGLWTVAILVLAILQLPPLLVLGFVMVYVYSAADATPATIFAIYGIFISTSDTWLKPMLLGRGLSTPMLVILLGAIGGMVLNGVIGLFVGAVVLALGYELFMVWLNGGKVEAASQD